ncbi:MAG: hypothetical protein R3C10_01095 [Pirellulales bacterium]
MSRPGLLAEQVFDPRSIAVRTCSGVTAAGVRSAVTNTAINVAQPMTATPGFWRENRRCI